MSSKIIPCLFATCALSLLSCATPLVNSGLLDLAGTTNDLAVRQIILNLARTKDNQFALPSQVGLRGGSVTSSVSLTAGLTTPLNQALTEATTTSATGALSSKTTTTSLGSTTANIAGTGAVTQSQWQIQLVQDTEPLRRLRLLYQYGSQQITNLAVLCYYPIPQLPQKEAQQSKATTRTDPAPKKRYVRSVANDPFVCHNEQNPNIEGATLVGENPDPAFLNLPGCVLCAFPDPTFNKEFKKQFSHRNKIFVNPYGVEIVKYNSTDEFVPVFLNVRLLPNSVFVPKYYKRELWDRKIDWLSVVKDGIDPIPDNSRAMGSSNGYTIYIHPVVLTTPGFSGDDHFSEFILSITEAALQPPELRKAGPTPPPLVQNIGP